MLPSFSACTGAGIEGQFADVFLFACHKRIDGSSCQGGRPRVVAYWGQKRRSAGQAANGMLQMQTKARIVTGKVDLTMERVSK